MFLFVNRKLVIGVNIHITINYNKEFNMCHSIGGWTFKLGLRTINFLIYDFKESLLEYSELAEKIFYKYHILFD